MGPKSFSAVMVRKMTAQSERHQIYGPYGIWGFSDPEDPHSYGPVEVP